MNESYFVANVRERDWTRVLNVALAALLAGVLAFSSAQTLRLFPPRAEKKPNPPAPIVSAQQTIRNAWDRADGYLNKWLPEKSPEKSG